MLFVCSCLFFSHAIYRYGISQLRSPQRHPANKTITPFTALQERAKQYFNDPSASDVTQLLEEFCRECDKHVDENKEKFKSYQEEVRITLLQPIHTPHFISAFCSAISWNPFSLHENLQSLLITASLKKQSSSCSSLPSK